MKRVFLSLAIVFLVFLQGCGGISQDEFDKIVAEKNALNEEMEALKTEQEETQKELSAVKAENTELRNEKAEKVEATMKLAAPKAWAATHFGDNCIVLVDNEEYLQIVSEEEYTASADGVQAIWKNVLEASATLSTMLDQITYDKIGIKFLQQDNKELVEIVFWRKNGRYELCSISGDLENCSILSAAFMAISK